MPAKGNKNYTDVPGTVFFKTDAKGRQPGRVFNVSHRKRTASSSNTACFGSNYAIGIVGDFLRNHIQVACKIKF